MMSPNNVKFFLSIFLATFTCILIIWAVYNFPNKHLPRIETPNVNWEEPMFKEISSVLQLSDLQDLRKTRFGKDDLEIRIWRLPGPSPFESIIIKRENGIWTAINLKTEKHFHSKKTAIVKLNEPRSGWDSLFEKLVNNRIFTLPDFSKIDCEGSGIDGKAYMIEYVFENKYRIYGSYVSFKKCEEVKQLEKIGEIVAEEFDNGEGTCKTTEWIACARFIRENNKK